MATEQDGRTPRAVIHKRILDEASEHPDASLQKLAEATQSASTDLVEKVLDEYGDPVDNPQPMDSEEPGVDLSQAGSPSEGTQEDKTASSVEDLSAKHRETLRKIEEEPTATQREIGEALGVSAATICNRLNDIAGFSWQNRQEFVSTRVEPALVNDGNGQVEQEAPPEVATRLGEIEDRLQELESDTHQSPLAPELAHKVLHACMKSDEFSEDEELELIRALLGE